MIIYKHRKNGRLYKIYEVTPRMYATTYYESEDLITGEIKRFTPYGQWQRKDMIPVGGR